ACRVRGRSGRRRPDWGDARPDRILIANPSPSLETHLIADGFVLESAERLEALGLSLMVAAPPRGVAAADALRQLRAEFPSAIIALDDPFYLATDVRSGRGKFSDRQRVLKSIGWQAYGANVGAGLRIGAIDSSVDLAHPALQGALIVKRSFTSGKAPTTDTAHGTAIAAMLVGRSDGKAIAGLLRGATLFHAGIFQKGKRGPVASSGDFLRAVDWLVRSGATVINASVTSPTENAVVLYAMSMLSHEDVILVAAAGNRGPNGPPAYPAAIDSAFAVTAVSLDGDAYEQANTGDYIDIAAPGIDLPTTSRRITSGTSLAAPFVTAAVARMVQMCGLTPIDAEESLQANARDLGPRGRDSSFGWGLLQAPRCAAPQLSARHPLSTR
ncbi:MAG TPA: S8 family serine peptidase, partial [Dongiaceae bacterium]|nr:S8 family serine peptidase [Dongiaceae bacterium]